MALPQNSDDKGEAQITPQTGALAARLGHDFNNVFAAILAQLELALYATDMPESLRGSMLQIQTAARRGADLAAKTHLLGCAAPACLTPQNLAFLASNAVYLVQRTLPPKVTLECHLPSDPSWVACVDGDQVQHAVQRLIVHACDAMPDGGAISLSLKKICACEVPPMPMAGVTSSNEWLRLTVQHQRQTPLPPQCLQLFTGSGPTNPFAKGIDLGLVAAHQLVRMNGGCLVHEQPEGQGAMFHLCFPLAAPTSQVIEKNSPPAQPSKKVPQPAPPQTSCRILLADDENQVRQIVRAVLSHGGYDVAEACNGRDAVALYTGKQAFDLVILDLDMPEMNGWEALRQIKQHNPDARALLLSGDSDLDIHQTAKCGGHIFFLGKPFENKQLLDTVAQALQS